MTILTRPAPSHRPTPAAPSPRPLSRVAPLLGGELAVVAVLAVASRSLDGSGLVWAVLAAGVALVATEVAVGARLHSPPPDRFPLRPAVGVAFAGAAVLLLPSSVLPPARRMPACWPRSSFSACPR